MKNKNPLYVVKGKDVLEASSILDLVIKKFNLGPAIDILRSLFKMLLEQVENFTMFKIIKGYLDEILKAILSLKTTFFNA